MWYLQSAAHDPSDDPVVAPDQNVHVLLLTGPPPVCDDVPVVVEQLQALDAPLQAVAVEAVHKLKLRPEIFLRQVVQHPRVHKALHKSRSVLRQT